MHHPISFIPFSGGSLVVDQGLFETNQVVGVVIRVDWPVYSGRLPEARASCDSIWSYAVSILSSPQAEEVGFLLS